MSKKIIIDAFQYSPSVTGTDRMAYNFLKELQKIDSVNKYYVMCSQQPYTRSAISAPNFKVIRPPRVPFLERYVNYAWRKLSSLLVISKRADVYYSFHNMQLPKYRGGKKMIASNLDLIPILLDEYKNLGRLSYDEQLAEYKRVVDAADAFMSISNYSKKELSETLNVPPSKVTVIQLAADPNFGRKEKSDLADLGINGKFIFTLGGSEPRKNVKEVVEAYNKLPAHLQKEYALVIAGGQWHHHSLKALKTNPNVILLGYVPDDALPSIYSSAACFVFASEYEGFGFTLLEAMACGTPVINTHGSSLDEVAEDATLSYSHGDSDKLKHLLEKLLRDTNLQKELTAKGYKQNKKFSWESAAQKLHKLLTD